MPSEGAGVTKLEAREALYLLAKREEPGVSMKRGKAWQRLEVRKTGDEVRQCGQCPQIRRAYGAACGAPGADHLEQGHRRDFPVVCCLVLRQRVPLFPDAPHRFSCCARIGLL